MENDFPTRKNNQQQHNPRAPIALSEISSQLWNVLENIQDVFIILDTTWKFTYINKKARYIFHRNCQYLIGKHIWTELPELTDSPFFTAFEKAAHTGNYTCIDEYYYHISHRWLSATIYPSPDGLFIFIRDITLKKEAQTALQQSEEKYRLLIDHLENIRETERTNISREIHDELGQQLTILKMDISWLHHKLKHSDDATVLQRTEDTINMLNETIKTVRRIATELRPGMLDDLGLVAAMEWQSREFENRSGIKITFESNVTNWPAIPAVTTSLFRIYQEALTNIGRHAKANHVFSYLKLENNKVTLNIKDDGQGFDMPTLAGKKTLGILGMKERALMMKGQLEMHSMPGKGTTIVVTALLQNPEKEQE